MTNPINESTKWLYGKLTGLGYNVGKDVNEFDNLIRTNAESRQWAYDTARKNGLNVGKDMDEFSSLVGGTVAPPATAQAQPQQTPATASTVKPITDNTAQQATVQPAQAQGQKLTPMQQMGFQMQIDGMNARMKQQKEQFDQRMEGIKKGNKPGAFMGEREFNPTTGKMETNYYTTQGERVGSMFEQSQRNTEYNQWWENNTEDGKRHKEQRLQREFDERLATLWQRHNPTEGENAAEQAWSAAEARQKEAANRIASEIYRDRGDVMSNAAFLGGHENHIMNAAMNTHRKQVAHYTNFDLDRLMNDSWDNLGEAGQKALIDDCYKMLRYRNPGLDELVLYNQAKQFARQQSDLRLYNLAVEKNLPKGNLEYLMRKIGDMNMIANISKGIAVSSANGKTGDMAAYEAANEQYRQDGHKILDVTGTVAGFALDPTTWLSAGVGSAATKGAMWAGGRYLAGRGATAAVTNAATRQFATSMTGRIVGGVVGGAANFGTFEGVKEMENQFAHGGHVVGQDETGKYINEGYSAGAVAGQFGHGLLMGGAIGWLGPVSGNVSDKLVRGTSSTVGKVATRAGVYTGATMAEGTIFSVPEWIEGDRDGFDVWTDNMAMMVGFKAKHILKSAGGVLGDLKASFDSPANGAKNRLDFESRLRMRMDTPSDGGMALTKDEEAELKRYGYDLRDLVESAERTGDASEGNIIAKDAPEIVSRLTDMVTDPRVSEAARAKMYYYATGRKLPMSTIMKGELYEDGKGGFIVESQGANGVITSRSFKNRKEADLELQRINRQTELNSIEIGERYQQTTDFENRLQEACRTVASENGWDMVEVYRTCEEARRNYLRGGDKQFDEAQQNILRKVTDAMGEFEETGATDAMRGRINEKYGVDIDAAIRKEANRRTQAEQTAIDEYIDELIPDKAKDRPVEDADVEDITNQKSLPGGEETFDDEFGNEPIDPRFDGGEVALDYDPHQPGGEQKPIGRAVMKYKDRPVEVLSGRVVMMEDGTMIDNERSDNSIVIRDLATGEIEMVSPEAILSYEEYAASVDEAETTSEQGKAPEASVEEQSKYTSGQIKIRNSDGTETRGVLTGYVDEDGKHEYYVEGDLQHLHYASEFELDNILSDYQPDAPQEPITPKDSQGNDLSVGDEIVLSAGRTGIVSDIQPNGAVTVDHNGESVTYNEQFGDITATGLRKVTPTPVAEEVPTTVPETAESVPTTAETTENPSVPVPNSSENGNNGGVIIPTDGNIGAENIPVPAAAPQSEVAQPQAVEPTPLQRIPRDEKGEPIFEQADSPETAWDALVEFSEGDAATAKEIADTMAEEKRKAFEKAQKQKPKGKTPTEILASKKTNSAELAKAESEYLHWQKMANVEQSRQNAIRSQQEAEARQRAAERAEAEKAEREAREEAARLEREALEGIPEWHMDTPENARKRGARRYGGQMFTRQEPVQNVPGKEVEVKFSQKDLPKGRVAVIEAEQLQPSHTQGQRNPMFFIEEAQPKNRSEAVSMNAARDMAEGIRPQEITGSATAYTGAPTVNTRGEVIQGNNRSDALRYLWQNNLPEQQQTYKQYLLDNAEQLGLDTDAVGAMQHPVLVNMLDVDDADAIRLGQMTAQDTESGGIERIKPKNVAQKLGEGMRSFATRLLSSGDDEATFGQLVDRNGTEVLKWMNHVGAISNTQFQSAFDSKGSLTAEAKNDLQKVLYQAVFKGGSQQLEEMFDRLPAKAQRAILSTAFRDMDSPFAGKMLPEIQSSIIAYNELMQDPAFESAKNLEEALRTVEAFKRQISLDDRFEQYMPADNFSNFALQLAAMYKASDMSQTTIASYFNQMYDLAQGKKAATLFEEADTTEYPLAEVIKQVLGIDYEPAKNGNNNVTDGGANVALRNQVGQGGELRGNEPPANGEQTPTGTEPSERGAGTSDNSIEGGRDTNVNGGTVDVEANGGLADEITPAIGPFGEIYTQFKGKSQEAIAYLLDKKSGEAVGALHHKEIGDIDLVYGKEGTGHSDGYGLAKLAKYHPEVLNNLQDILNDMVVTKRSENRVQLESEKYQAAVRLKWDNKKKTWLLTMFEKKNSVLDNTTDTGKTLVGNGNDTATPENTVISDGKDNTSLPNEQISEEEIATQHADVEEEQTLQASIKAAASEVNTEPTPAQAEAGNYKKGHITIGEFDITIENPAGSVRKGVDADGKEWQTTMANTYGYIKGTEGVDGDHIDVFLHSDMDQWDGRKAFVVDQTNTDGSFDEHKVMLGFNDKDEAMSAYLANYDADWAQTHPGLRISETNIEDFNKWVESSHRKTKPFADYSTVSKVSDDAPATKSAPVVEGNGYKVDPKPYTNKQGKTLDTYLVTFDRDFSKEELSAIRSKAKALKGWYDRETRGWMLRSSDDAKAFAEDIIGKSDDEVADEAPLSMADMERPTEAPVKKVDVPGVFDALKTKGEAKLSDHAKTVEQPKPKKRKWISDEDAAEFDSLRDNLRNHFGKSGDMVQEDAVGYGQPQPKQMDAEVLRMGTRMTYLMMKGGLRSFSDYCEAMKDELPDIFDDMRPHLKSLYAAAQNMEEVMQLGWDEEMDDRKTVKAFDVYNFDKPEAKDIIATAQHTVDEQASQQQTEQIIQTLKDKRNEQRKKEADDTSADTEIIVDKAETTASEVESKLEAATTEQDAERLSHSIDKELDEVNKQLALLGYYEAEEVDKDFNEAYGYMRNAERKATQDAHNLATQLATDLGLTIDPKDRVRKSKYNFGSKIAHSNVAPAGGEVYIKLPLAEGRELSMTLSLDKNEPWLERGRAERPDDLVLTRIMFRVEDKTGKSTRYVTSNDFISPTSTYDELLAHIRRSVRHLLPEETVQPATPLTPQPGEDMVQMAERVSKDRKAKKPQVKPEQPIGDLFGGLFDNIDAEADKPQSVTTKTKENEKSNVQPRTKEEGRGGQQPRPNEPLGESAKHEDERTDGGRMAERGGEHTVSDTERSGSVSQPHQSERGVTEPKNTRNNHTERGVDYAPKGEKARIDANLAAIELAKKLLASGATATPKEMEVLRRYSGWGGLGAAFNEGQAWAPNPINKRLRELLTPEEYEAAVMSRNSAYYTPAPVIDAMWDIAKALGFKGGNIMEGSAGIGNIIGLMPSDISKRSDIHAVEIDDTTGGILSLLYPDANVEIHGFEKTRIGNGTVDLAITNVPFVTGLHVMDESGDSDLSKKFRDIHDFCIAKNVRKLREGGIGIFITSSGTLDKSQKLRNWLVGDKEGCADVVGAFRMNNQTFGGTAATSDIIVIRKRVNGRKSPNAIDVSTVSVARTASFEDDKGKTKDLPMLINRYFIEHPENMGGEMFFGFEQGDTYRPTSIGLFPTRTADQAGRMAAWVQRMADMDWKTEAVSKPTEQTSHINETLGEGVKEGSMVTDSDGNLCVARMGRAVPLTINKNKIKGRTKEECFKDYSEIKDALAEVLKYQTEHEDDAGLQPLLDRLNKAYDTFVERYGNLNKNNNLAWLRNDVDFSSIVALETYSEKGSKDGQKIKTYGKTDIFSRRVVEKESEPAPKNVKDGIIASIYKFGRIDPKYLATQLGKSDAEVKQEIIDSGLGFENPTTGQMEVSYEYLSGNVREKLRQAREANEAAGGGYEANIKALEAVVPMNIPAHLIEFTLGSSWVEPKLYERYIKERTGLDVKLTNAGGTWNMNEPYYTDEPKNKEMGVRSEKLDIFIPGHKLIEAAITNKTITVNRTVKDTDGTHTETDPAATTACATKVDEIRQDFKDWAREQMQSDPDLSMRMEEVYNEQFNNSVPKSIPDEFVPEHFGGAATIVGGKPFQLRPHQAKAVIRATTQPVLLAHEVGTGKTYTLITTAMEMRRLGTARKPMIVVQNATVGQFVASAKALYPNAKVLTLEDADRNAEGRRAFYAKIKFNDWDMIVVPQSVFERIPDSIERQTQFIQDVIDEKLMVLEQMQEADPSGKSQIVRAAKQEIERKRNELSQLANGGTTDKKKEKDAKKAAVTRQNAEVKAREMLDRATDDVEDFDSMGIDAVLVDEAHEYKHLGFATAMQRGVKGVDPSYSKKSQGVFLKVQSVLEKTGGKNVVFATGTPISNTAAEIWTFMRYLMPADVMKDYGIYYFDDFVRNFGNLQQMMEFKTNGKFGEVNRFAGYVNLPELVRIWSTVADTVLTREAGGVSDKIPQMEGGKATDLFMPQTRALRSVMKYVKEQLDEYEKMSGKEKKENSHIPLTMYGIAKAAAVDARLVQRDAEDDANSKCNEAVRQTLRTLEETKDYKGTVAIFADNYQRKNHETDKVEFNLFEDIRKKLIDAGVPSEQIVVMKSGMTVNKKLDIFSRVNSGEVRVVMGSTFTLGTGVNIQERLHTLIHLDAPNRPMDYTQRNGRILRQGNLHNEWGMPVRVLRFGVEDSLDVTAYQRLKTKGAIAYSIMNGKQLMDNSMENRSLEEEQDLFGDITAQLSGSEYALLKNQIEKEVRKLTAQLKNWEADQTYIHNRKRQIAGQNREAEQRIAANKTYLEKVEAATIGDITVGKLSFPSIDAMEDFFTEQNKKKAELQEKVRKDGYSSRPATSDIFISVGGFDFHVHTEISRETKSQQGSLFYTAPAKMTYSCPELGIEAMPVKENKVKNAVTEIMNDVVSGEDFRGRIEAAERYIERNNAELQSISARDGVPFKDAEALAKAEEKLAEYEELMKQEMEAKEAKYAEMDKDVEAASNIELTEEDSDDVASEPVARYSAENSNFASRYETKDGKTIGYTSENPKAYGVSEAKDGTANSGTREADIQRQGDNLLAGRNSRLNTEAGEFSLVERVFTKNGSFNFTSGEKIESADDVAFIFSALEDAAKEHAFVVYVKDGRPTVVELGMGTFTATMVDIPTASLAYNRIRPDQVYFVHNHPSGNLKCSLQDVQMLQKIEGMCDVPVSGVIINLKTGKYGTFDTSNNTGVGNKRTPENESRLTVHTLDKQIFAPDYDPMAQSLVRMPSDVAQFLNSHRMGDRAKVSFLILTRAGRIVGNIHTPFTEISSNPKEVARYISERVIQFGGESAILYGDFPMSSSDGKDYKRLKDLLAQVGGNTLLDVMRVEGNHTRSANDEGLLYEPGSEYGASQNGDIRFREVEDDAILTEFAEGKTVKAYRTMQVIDGKLYSPMATKVGGKSTPEIKLGVPEQSEEHPEIIKGTKVGRDGIEQGYVVIDKGLGKGTLTVAYNPYAHTSRTVLNDQFSSAYIRPNLVTVEVEVPESELTSGYRAPMAKDAVGEISWHSGSVSGQLAELGQPRRVILTRYDRPVRIVPFREVAEMIAAQLDGTDIAIPYNVVQPQLRSELERLGIAVSEEATGTVADASDFGKAEYVTDQEIERINAHQQEMAQTSNDAKTGHAERLSKKFGTPVRIVTDANELTNANAEQQARMRKSKGFYDPATGEVVVVLPNNANVEDVAETVFHEVVAHKGLREMIGDENYDTFCDEVYDHLKDDLKKQVDEESTRRFMGEPGKDYQHHRRVAIDEMFGRMSEKGFEDFTKAERGIWAKLKAKVLEAINKFLGSLKLPKWVKLGDNELRYILWRSHEKLRSKGDYVDMARDAAKRNELGLSNDVRFRDSETGDIWNDRSVGLEERITNAAIRLSNNQSGDLTLRNDAMKAIGGNLTSLRRAMAIQKQFDQSTVKRVADLARILMQNGYLSGMSSGEMQRLISAVKNSVGHAAVKESTQKIMDIMVDNQLRNGEATLRKLLTIRGSKVDARGVEVQGALDVDGQRTMEVVKKAMSLKEDDINDRIADALNRMSDPDQTIADKAAIEYTGLNMALDYVQNIADSKAEEKALRDGLKTVKEDKDAGRMTEDAYKQFVDATENAIRKNKIERAEAYFNLVGRLSDSLRGSIENAKAFREAEKARINEIHHNANSDMEGRPTNEHHKDNWKDKFVNNGFIQSLFAPLGTFDQILRVFGNKSAGGEGYLWNRFMRGWVDCRNKELLGVKEKFARLDEKAAELFGKGKIWGNLIRMEAKMPKATVSFWDGGEMRDHELTQGNLLYIYMVDKMTDGRMKLRRMGITEDDITSIENFLDPRFKVLGDWLQNEFLVSTRNEYNETHKRMFGASMAAIENYFPLKILANARIDKEEDVNQPNKPDGITTKTGSIIKRRVNNLALDITGADALSVILDHITQMEHWSAYAEWNRDLNTLRTYKRFRNQVINMTTVYGGGRKLWENFNDLCLMAAGEYRPSVSKLNKSAVNLAKGVTAAKVSFRMYTALKQFLSAPAYIPEVSTAAIAKSIANPYGDFKWCLENMPIFRERWHSRISGDPRLLKSDMDWNMWRSRVMEISSRIGMTPNAFVDAVTVSIGARAMYETRLKQYLKEGYPTDSAEKRAMQDATILFNQTQQSSESPFMSTMQADKDWFSTIFTVFRNSAMSYTRQQYDAMRNLKRNLTPGQRAKSIEFMTKQILRDWDVDPDTATDAERDQAQGAAQKRFRRQLKKDVLRVATFGYILEWLWNLGPYLPYLIFGYYLLEKDKMWEDAFTHAYFGSVEGLTGGDVISSFGNMWASGEWNWNQLSKDMPLASDINTIANKFIGGKNAEAINDIINLLVQSGVGMNPQSITDAAVAITDACGDDPALSHEAAIFVMRVLQVPQSQIDKMYFDEIGLSGEEASKLTPEQLAQRYAEYKVKRGTPLAPWSWGDEERLDKYHKVVEDKMKERLDSRGDAAVNEAYADFEARYKAVDEKAKEARALMRTDYAAAAQAHAALQQDPDFTLYQRFGSLDKQLGRISKMWLTSKTPEEANLVASAVTSYRAGMVKVLQAETVESQQSAMKELTDLLNDFYSKYQAMQPKPSQLNR
nr:MAG TPA: crystallin beta/gamma motif-containing protein [Caudoviricetes sp.]